MSPDSRYRDHSGSKVWSRFGSAVTFSPAAVHHCNNQWWADYVDGEIHWTETQWNCGISTIYYLHITEVNVWLLTTLKRVFPWRRQIMGCFDVTRYVDANSDVVIVSVCNMKKCVCVWQGDAGPSGLPGRQVSQVLNNVKQEPVTAAVCQRLWHDEWFNTLVMRLETGHTSHQAVSLVLSELQWQLIMFLLLSFWRVKMVSLDQWDLWVLQD